MRCLQCQADNPEAAKFCMNCGARLQRARGRRTRHPSIEEDLTRQAAAEAKVSEKDEVQVEVRIKPPPPVVKTIRDLIYWEYAKTIAESAGLEGNYGFIMDRFKKLKAGEIKWRDPDEDAKRALLEEKACIYCGSTEGLTIEHLIPRSRGGPDIPANTVIACRSCNASKGSRDVFEWYFVVKKAQKIPRKVWSRYLRLVWDFHVAHRTLDRVDLNKDGVLNILDLGTIFRRSG